MPGDEPREGARRGALDLGVLAVLGAGIVALTAWTARWEVAAEHPGAFAGVAAGQLLLYGAAAAWVLWRRPPGRGALLVVLLVAAAARGVLVPHAPDVSDDVYRYVWDGRVAWEGINPYRYTPEDPALAPLRDAEIYPGINRRSAPTIYPPVAQAVFAGVYRPYPDSVTWTKGAFAALDVLAVLVLALVCVRLGLRPERTLLYAWHPLAILEVGRSGHVDALVVLLVGLAILAHTARRPAVAGALAAGATLVKLYAAVVLPALVWCGRRRSRGLLVAFGATAVVAYLPFLGVGTRVLGYLPGFLEEEGFDSGERYRFLHHLETLLGDGPPGESSAAATAYLAVVALVLAGAALWCWRRPPASARGVADRALGLALLLFVLTTPSQPWYLLLALGLVPLARAPLAVAGAVLAAGGIFTYLEAWLPDRPGWPLDLAWGSGAAALAVAALWMGLRARRGPRSAPRAA